MSAKQEYYLEELLFIIMACMIHNEQWGLLFLGFFGLFYLCFSRVQVDFSFPLFFVLVGIHSLSLTMNAILMLYALLHSAWLVNQRNIYPSFYLKFYGLFLVLSSGLLLMHWPIGNALSWIHFFFLPGFCLSLLRIYQKKGKKKTSILFLKHNLN